MGALFLFDKSMMGRFADGKGIQCTIEVVDNHGVPEIRIGPEGAAYKGWTASFNEWADFREFMDAVDDLYERLRRIKE